MAVNPTGYVAPFDAGNPRTIGGIAIGATSGGQLCFASGVADCVSSGLNSFVTGDIMIATGASGAAFNGVALQGAASGTYVSLVTKAVIIARVAGTVIGGQPVAANGVDDFIPLASVSGTDVPAMVTQAIKIKAGRAWTNATSGNYALIELTP